VFTQAIATGLSAKNVPVALQSPGGSCAVTYAVELGGTYTGNSQAAKGARTTNTVTFTSLF
jgi:hypothetical protein